MSSVILRKVIFGRWKTMEKVCAVCSSKAPQRCSSCSSVWYCSAEHQKVHWKIHRKSCPFFKIVDEPKLGKGFVATRDIKPGTLILEEGPLAVYHSKRSVCLSCGLAGDGMEWLMGLRKCSKCKLPVCSSHCERLSIHAENECQIFKTKTLPDQHLKYMKDLILAIRVCMLKRNNPALYQQVLQLCPNLLLLNLAKAKALEDFLLISLTGVEGLEINSEEIGKILRILHTNCHSYQGFDMRGQMSFITGLFLQSSRMNHSCIPNCHLQLCSNPEFKVRVRTTSAVKKGEALTYFYYMECLFEGTQRRQETIQRDGNFLCECTRCKDPTELGTYMSGIVCETCKRKKTSTLGYLLPEDPLNLSFDAKWKCNCCGCIKKWINIFPEVEIFAQRISELEAHFATNEFLVQCCMRLVDETSGITLHPNHWIIQKAIGVMGRCLPWYRQTEMSLDLSDYLIKCWKQLLSIHDVLISGLPRSRAILHEQLATVLRCQSAELIENKNFKQAEISCEEALVHLKEALKFFEKDVPAAADLVKVAERIKEDISLVLEDLAMLRLKFLKISGSKK